MTFRALIEQGVYYTAQIWAGWTIKLPIAAIGGYYASYVGGDVAALVIYFLFFGLDLFFGTWLAIKEHRFDPVMFGGWVIKVGSHFFVLLVVGIALKSMLVPINFWSPGWINFLVGLLICTEATSILKRMHDLGLPVPKIAVKILTQAQKKAEKTATNLFRDNGHHEHERREDGDHEEY